MTTNAVAVSAAAELPNLAEKPAMSDKACNARVISREDVTQELFVLKVAPMGWTLPDFEPGQYAELAIPDPVPSEENKKLVRRQYSIASAPKEKNWLEFFIVRVADGALTPKLAELSFGGELWMNPKIKGKFTLAEIPSGKDLIMISTGTGIAPFISMLRQYRDQNRWRRLIMINCVRYSPDLGYRTELEEAVESDRSLVYVPLVTREPEGSGWCGLRGRVQTVLEPARFKEVTGIAMDPAESHVLLCGNPEMIDGALPLLEGQGFKQHSKKNPGNVHFERFW